MDKITYVTKEGLQKLEEEYCELKEKIIPEIAARIDDAKHLGDLSENAEYHSAKENMGWAQSRLFQLEDILRYAVIIEQTNSHDIVKMGSSIVVEQDGAEKTYTIVGSTEVDPKSGKISHESPLGRAFIDKSQGETVSITLPSGIKTYLIKKIIT